MAMDRDRLLLPKSKKLILNLHRHNRSLFDLLGLRLPQINANRRAVRNPKKETEENIRTVRIVWPFTENLPGLGKNVIKLIKEQLRSSLGENVAKRIKILLTNRSVQKLDSFLELAIYTCNLS